MITPCEHVKTCQICCTHELIVNPVAGSHEPDSVICKKCDKKWVTPGSLTKRAYEEINRQLEKTHKQDPLKDHQPTYLGGISPRLTVPHTPCNNPHATWCSGNSCGGT